MSQENIDSFVEGFSDKKISQLLALLEPQIDEPISHELPENSGAITGVYTEKPNYGLPNTMKPCQWSRKLETD